MCSQGLRKEISLPFPYERAGRQPSHAPEDPGLSCLSCPLCSSRWPRELVTLRQPTCGLEIGSSSNVLPMPISPLPHSCPCCHCGACVGAGRADPWAHLVNVVHDFLHAVLHCAQVLVFPELWEGHREISRLASTSSLQWVTVKMQAPARRPPLLPPHCPQPGPAPRIGVLCVTELISGREEESERKQGPSSAAC